MSGISFALGIDIQLVTKEFKMTFTKITIAALMTVIATTSFASTFCLHKDRSGLFASTNPVKAVKAGTTNTQGAVR